MKSLLALDRAGKGHGKSDGRAEREQAEQQGENDKRGHGCQPLLEAARFTDAGDRRQRIKIAAADEAQHIADELERQS